MIPMEKRILSIGYFHIHIHFHNPKLLYNSLPNFFLARPEYPSTGTYCQMSSLLTSRQSKPRSEAFRSLYVRSANRGLRQLLA